MELQLIFVDSLSVSQDEEPDNVIVLLKLSDYKDEYGFTLPLNTFLEVMLPRQLLSDKDIVDTTASTAEAGAAGIAAGNFIANAALSASLNQLWSVINGLQLVVHLPLLNCKFPANASLMNDKLISIAQFDFMNTFDVVSNLFYFPELKRGAPSLMSRFQQTGYDANYFI